MPKSKGKFQRVEVLWNDAVHHCENSEVNKDWKTSKLKTIGYLIEEKDNGDLVIASEVDLDDPNWARHISVIPDGMIKEWWEI